MRKNYIKLGDIILIPVDGDRCGVAKIIYLSKYFKNIIFLNIYPILANISEVPVIPISINNELLIYTGNHKIKTEEWRKVGNLPVSAEEKILSKRIVGGDVWIEDDYFRAATEEEYATLPRMLVSGSKLVEDKIIKYLSSINLI